MTSFDELLKMYEDEFFASIRLGQQIIDHDLMALLILEVIQLRKDLKQSNIKVQNEIHSGLTKLSRTFDPYYTKQSRR